MFIQVSICIATVSLLLTLRNLIVLQAVIHLFLTISFRFQDPKFLPLLDLWDLAELHLQDSLLMRELNKLMITFLKDIIKASFSSNWVTIDVKLSEPMEGPESMVGRIIYHLNFICCCSSLDRSVQSRSTLASVNVLVRRGLFPKKVDPPKFPENILFCGWRSDIDDMIMAITDRDFNIL